MKKKDDDNDPNWKNGVYIGKTNVVPASDIQEYKKYAEELAKKGRDFLLFSDWREKFQTR